MKKFDIRKILPAAAAIILAVIAYGTGIIKNNGNDPIETGIIETVGESETAKETEAVDTEPLIDENGRYNSKDEVALYIKTYGHLPPNYVTKKLAKEKGWQGGSVEKYFPGCSIGGDYFGNAEGLLPKKDGRVYYECDIDTAGKPDRGEKRIVYSNDRLVYYTDDHYKSYTLIYGGDNESNSS